MYVVVDHREAVIAGYTSGFTREGFASMGFCSGEFRAWLATAPDEDIAFVQSFLLGDVDGRASVSQVIRNHSRAPIIAISDDRCLDRTLELFSAGIDDVVRKPVHVREIVARSDAIWRRVNDAVAPATTGRLKVFFDGRDPLIDEEVLALPRRERHILEYLVKNSARRITKTQLFNAIYGVFNDNVDDTVIEGHISKLRKKLRQRLGHDVIDGKRFMGYRFVG
jgi:DNA-binding response OmpR family regulator